MTTGPRAIVVGVGPRARETPGAARARTRQAAVPGTVPPEALAVRRLGRVHRSARRAALDVGFTVLEVVLVAMLVGTLAAIATPVYFEALNAARIARTRADVKNISTTIDVRRLETGRYPDSLADVGFDHLRDPWGHPYEYLRLEGTKNHGKARKDKNLVPLNSDYDLYSMGRDGRTVSPLTARASRDDIVRANNGGFIGLGADY